MDIFRISSSRRLETESYRNIELKWLLCDQHPDFKTIAVKELEAISDELKEDNRKVFYPNDPDARLMKSRNGFIPAYNMHTGTDALHKMIVMAEVTTEENDINLLEENCQNVQVQEQVNIIPETVLADTGYGNMQQIETLETGDQTIQCIIPRQFSSSKRKDKANGIEFTYDVDTDSFSCPEKKKLVRKKRTSLEGSTIYFVYQASNIDCRTCPRKKDCHPSKAREGRSIKVPENYQYRSKYDKKIDTPDSRKLIKNRKALIEHIFGTLKRWMGKVPILLTSKEKVQIEVDLYATAYNIRRLISITPVSEMLIRLQNTCI